MSYYSNTSFKADAGIEDIRFGSTCDWYNDDNVEVASASVPRRYCGGRYWPQAWFAFVSWTNHDEMKEFNTVTEQRMPVGGPFATIDEALSEAKSHVQEVSNIIATRGQ